METSHFRLRWTLGRKLAALVGLIIGLSTLGAIFTLSRMAEVGSIIESISRRDLPALAAATSVHKHRLLQNILLARAVEVAREDGAGGTRLVAVVARFEKESREGEEAMAQASALAAEGGADYAPLREKLQVYRDGHREFELGARRLLRELEAGGDGAAAREAVQEDIDSLDSDGAAMEAVVHDIASRDAEEAEQSEAKAFQVTLALAAVSAVVGIVLSVWIVRLLVGSVRAVTARAQELARGELGGEALAVRTSDEIGQLASVFNTMAAALAGQVRDTWAAIKALTGAAAEILAAAKQQAAAAKQQAATIQEVTASVEEIGQSGSQMSDRAAHVAGRARDSAQSSATGRHAMQETSGEMESIRQQIEEVAENIVSLSERASAVGEIIASVNEIAEQSNLLALNAAIEAAAAGEQGARFSVVASEIKNLADQAKDSTGQVRRILGEIQKGINAAVMLTEEAVKRSEEGRRKSQTTERAINDFVASSQESIDAFEQIVAGVGQQQIGIGQVAQGMQDIRQAVEQSAVGTNQLERAVADLNSLGKQLEGVVAKYTL